MAHKRNTIVRHMVENSGKSDKEVSVLSGKKDDYISRVLDGKVRVPVNDLVIIAQQCGYSVVFERGDDRMDLAPVQIPLANRSYEFSGSYDIGLSGRNVGVTGSFFGLDDESISSLMQTVGATYFEKFGKKTCDCLIVGDIDRYGGETKSTNDAEKWGYPTIDYTEFRERYLEASGVDIATC